MTLFSSPDTNRSPIILPNLDATRTPSSNPHRSHNFPHHRHLQAPQPPPANKSTNPAIAKLPPDTPHSPYHQITSGKPPFSPPTAPLPPLISQSSINWLKLIVVTAILSGLSVIAIWTLSANRQKTPTELFATALWNIVASDQLIVNGQLTLSDQTLLAPLSLHHASLHFLHQVDTSQFSTNATLTLTDQNNQTYYVGLDTITDDTGQWYARGEGTRSLLTSTRGDWQSIAQTFAPSFNLFEHQWWQINIPESIHYLNQQTDNSPLDDTDADTYQCLFDTLTAIRRGDKLRRLYIQSPFFQLTPYTGSEYQATNLSDLYTVSLDTTKLNSFYQSFLTADIGQNLRDCTSNFPSDTLPTDHLTSLWPTVIVELEPSTPSLIALHAWTESTAGATLDLTFDTISSPTFSLPDNYQSSTLLIDQALNDTSQTPTNETVYYYPPDYLETTTPAQRDQDRIYDLNIIGQTLDVCYDTSTDTYLSLSANHGEITPGFAAGPYATHTNPCLSIDVSPASADYPYTFATPVHTSGNRAGYAVCARLEVADNELTVGNSDHSLSTTDYHPDGSWSLAGQCQNAAHCYYCVTNH